MKTIQYYTQKEIRAALKGKLGKSFCKVLAERTGMSKAWVSRHITGSLRTKKGRRLIAFAMGVVDGKRVKMSQIYPE